MKLSIVVPCYNESKNIPLILSRFEEVIKREDIEVILVNNGSTDDSQSVFVQLINKYPFAKLVNVKENKGYGFGVLSGLKQADGEFIGWTHADMQTDPNDVIKALSIIEENNSTENLFIKGDRKGRSAFDQFFTSGMSLFESVYMGCKLWDINAQPNLFHKEFYAKWKDAAPLDFSLDLYVLYQAKKENLKAIRFDVVFPERIHGESSWNDGLGAKWKFIKRTLQFSFQLKRQL
tara:strand:+ start:10435 stop:11136 length:702 start_codon:yes stop_codon:yes gene_type:complete